MHRTQIGMLGAVLLASVSLSASAAGDAALERGRALYQLECAACHGVEGDGNGSGAYILSQKPRNLQLGVFKLRSTPSGEYPADQDLFDTLTRGIAGATGSMMPSFKSYPAEDRWALVAAIKEIALIDEPGEPIAIPPRPPVDVALGAEVYDRLECQNCHGEQGAGDGTSSLTLEDDGRERTWVPDLRQGRYKGGGEPEDLYKRIVTGLSGSPMPAYAGKASDAELWALVDFVRSLASQTVAEK